MKISCHSLQHLIQTTLILSLVNCLKNNNVSGFLNIKLIQSKRQSPISKKKQLTKAEFGEALSGTFNRSDQRCECCKYLLINDHYTFKNVEITFKLKNRFTGDIFNFIYVVICGTCKEEYIGEPGKGKTKLRDRVRVYPNTFGNHNTKKLKVI